MQVLGSYWPQYHYTDYFDYFRSVDDDDDDGRIMFYIDGIFTFLRAYHV